MSKIFWEALHLFSNEQGKTLKGQMSAGFVNSRASLCASAIITKFDVIDHYTGFIYGTVLGVSRRGEYNV